MSKQIDRRNYLKYAAAGIIVVAGAAAGGYYFYSGLPKTKTIETPITTTKTSETASTTMSETPYQGLEELDNIKNIIKTEVEGVIVGYQEESFWTEDSFLKILESKDEFSSNLVNKFCSTVLDYGKEAFNPRVELNPRKNSTILTSEVHGAISRTENRYYATFEWLLRPMGLDFIDDSFKETIQGLSWEGWIDGVSTEIICKFPYTGSLYQAWTHPTGHCHAHVWWEL